MGGTVGFAGFIDPGEGYDQLTYADGGYTYWTDFYSKLCSPLLQPQSFQVLLLRESKFSLSF